MKIEFKDLLPYFPKSESYLTNTVNSDLYWVVYESHTCDDRDFELWSKHTGAVKSRTKSHNNYYYSLAATQQCHAKSTVNVKIIYAAIMAYLDATKKKEQPTPVETKVEHWDWIVQYNGGYTQHFATKEEATGFMQRQVRASHNNGPAYLYRLQSILEVTLQDSWTEL